MGFQSSEDSALAKTEDRVLAAVRETFNPEFINRLDEIIVFEPLSDDDLLRIIALLLDQLNRSLIRRQLEIRLTPGATQWILEQTCADRSYGARPLRRALQKYVEDPVSEGIIQGRIGQASVIEVFLDGDRLNYHSLVLEEFNNPDEVLMHQG
jgi:ATP-dependent Clp protease ATP-binding subunit ClpC